MTTTMGMNKKEESMELHLKNARGNRLLATLGMLLISTLGLSGTGWASKSGTDVSDTPVTINSLQGCFDDSHDNGTGPTVPKNRFNIMMNYELGMHCTGFEFSYCCVLPPYNSILAQVVRTQKGFLGAECIPRAAGG